MQPHSQYLPRDYDRQPIGLIAGKGRYPILMAEAIVRAGLPLRLVAFEGETEPQLIESLPKEHRKIIKVGQLGKLLKSLKKLGCQYATMAGQITPRRLFKGLHPDLKALAILNSLKEKNAETIFGAIASEIEALEISMLDARVFMDTQLSSSGWMTRSSFPKLNQSIQHGIRIAKGVAELDVGQGAVVRNGTVLAVEAYEGTDPMLQRAGSFKTDNLVFVKTTKHRQDFRFDVPVFGDRTLRIMNEVGIHCAALEENAVIMLDKQSLLEEADRLGIGLYGYRQSSASS